MRKWIITDDLSYTVFAEIYQRYTVPKTRRRALVILESAAACFERRGFEAVTFKMIAREAGLTTSSLRYYFSDLDEIREYTMKHIHMIAQKIVIDAMKDVKNPEDILKKYLYGHAAWVNNFRRHASVWISFVTYSSRKKKDRELNKEALLNGAYRISEMLSRGKKAGVFTHKDNFMSARVIQTIILGWITTMVTEDIENPDAYTDSVFQQCFNVATGN